MSKSSSAPVLPVCFLASAPDVSAFLATAILSSLDMRTHVSASLLPWLGFAPPQPGPEALMAADSPSSCLI